MVIHSVVGWVQWPAVTPIRLALAVLLVALAAGSAAGSAAARDYAGPYQYDNVIYTPPPGWKKGRTSADNVILLNGEDGRYEYLRIYRSRPLPPDVSAWLRTFMAGDASGDRETVDKVLDVTPVQIGSRGAMLGASRMNDGDVRFYLAVTVGDGLELVRFEGGGDDEEELRQTTTSFQQIVDPFVNAMRFVSAGAAPLLGPPTPGPLEGIYFGSQLDLGFNMQMTMRSTVYVFDRQGRFLSDLPDGRSPQNVDFARAMRETPDDAGHYEIVGDKIVLRHADGETDEEEFEWDEDDGPPPVANPLAPPTNPLAGPANPLAGGAVQASADRRNIRIGDWLNPVEPLPDGTPLDGTFSSMFYSSTGFAGSDNFTSVSGGSSYGFTPAGRFSTDGFVGFSGSAGGGDAVTTYGGYSEKPDKAGTYVVKDGVITLTFLDGTVETKSAVLVGDSLLYLDGSQYLDRSKTDD